MMEIVSALMGATLAPTFDEFAEALRAEAPASSRGPNGDLYDGLIGSWEAAVVDHLPDGTERRQTAEIRFAWVLEGRAIQDVWIAPARPGRGGPPASGNRYGTTLRVYDPSTDSWKVTWINPVTGAENRLVGRRAGSEIMQTGTTADGLPTRWVFDVVREDAFHWRAEVSEDGGKTWRCDTEFMARRAAGPGATAATARRNVVWEWTDRPGLETLILTAGPAGAMAEGAVLVVLDGVPVRVRSRIEHDGAWRFREARIEVGSGTASRALGVRRRADGRWEVDGTLRADLDGCEDLDLMTTPYTNTPPLAARPLAHGEKRRLRVAWVRVPDLDVTAAEQEYARLDDAGFGSTRYRYRNLASGFTGELTVDRDGLVLDYGPWRRR